MRRRRFFQITALSALGLSYRDLFSSKNHNAFHQWEGYVLGAPGRIVLENTYPCDFEQVFSNCLHEVQRLEKLFSLYLEDSDLNRLNRFGFLDNPSADWIELLESVDWVHNHTNGLFDPTVQVIWKNRLHGQPVPDESLPMGWKSVNFSSQSIHFAKEGMQTTFNGIAQGFITDKVVTLLREVGFKSVLVELGETYGLGARGVQQPWRVGIKDPYDQNQLDLTVTLQNQALATTHQWGSTIGESGRDSHLIDPRLAQAEGCWEQVSVRAPTATQADGLATALSFATQEQIDQITVENPAA